MTKQECLEIIKLLSALESWSFAEKHQLPAHLGDNLQWAVDRLSDEVLK